MRHPFSAFPLLAFLLFSAGAIAQMEPDQHIRRASLREWARQKKLSDSLHLQVARQRLKEQGRPTAFFDSDSNYLALAFLDANGNEVFRITHNSAAALSTQTSPLLVGGSTGLQLEGQGLDIGEWDGGAVRSSHELLTGRVTQVDGSAGLSDHATHVAGTLVGGGVGESAARGMAPQAQLLAHDWHFDDSEMAQAAANGLLISNHSYGFVTGWRGRQWWGDTSYSFKEDVGFGIYGTTAHAWDSLSVLAPHYLIVKSAGNDRNDQGVGEGDYYFYRNNTQDTFYYDSSNPQRSPQADGGKSGYHSIGWQGNAKNILSVGAVHDVVQYQNPGDVQMSSFSSWGPTDDGRIKPDLVGNGVGLYSSTAGADNAYSSSSGTSMSAPNVAGSLLLLQELYQREHPGKFLRSASLKALAIHTARECGAHPGPDFQFGWGLLNTTATAELILGDSQEPGILREAVLANGESHQIHLQASGDEELRITLCWTDPPAAANTGLNQTAPRLVHDLDLRLSGNGQAWWPYRLDAQNPAAAADTGDNHLDNVEQIRMAQPAAGESFNLVIKHKGSLGGSQAYSLVISGAQGRYYSRAACSSPCEANVLSHWNSRADGSGFAPDDFAQSAHFYLQSGHHLQVSQDWQLSQEPNRLSLATGASLSVDSGASFSTAGSLHNQGNVYLANSASLVQSQAEDQNSGQGLYHITRHSGVLADRQRYQYWSAPVVGESLGSVFANANPNDFYHFEEASQSFVSQPAADSLLAGRGYATTPDKDNSSTHFRENRHFSGPVHNGPYSVALQWQAGNYALLGNPYPSAIDNTSFLTDNPGLQGALYFWNHSTPPSGGQNHSADYAIWNLLGATSGNGQKSPDDFIGTAQGFMVRSASAPPAVHFYNAQRVAGSNAQFFKRSGDSSLRMWLSARRSDGAFQQILVGFSAQASAGYDQYYDAKKYRGQPDFVFFSQLDSLELGIQSLGAWQNKAAKIPLGFYSNRPDSVLLQLDSVHNWPATAKAYLLNQRQRRWELLRLGSAVALSLPQSGEDKGNWFLHIWPQGSLSQAESPADQQLQFYQRGGNLHWQEALPEAWRKLEIYRLNGQKVRSIGLSAKSQKVFLGDLPTGLYLLKMQTEEGKFLPAQKLFWQKP